MPTNKRSLILLTPPEPPAELIKKALDAFMQSDLAAFASSLETAREMWARFPELIVAPGFPDQLRAAYVEEWEHEPDGSCESAGIDVFEPGHRETLLPHAIEVARGWMKKGNEPEPLEEERTDFDDWADKFLAEHPRETWRKPAASTALVAPLAVAAAVSSKQPQTRRGAAVTAIASVAALLRR